jgi:hypothetical protein
MGVAFDNTCVLWQPLSCSEGSGSCSFYDNKALSINFLILFLVVKCVSLIAMILAVFVYRPPAATTAVDVTVEVKADDAINSDKEGQKCIMGEEPNTNVQVTGSLDGYVDMQSGGLTNCGFIRDDVSRTETSHM